jgi:hypothetical protein
MRALLKMETDMTDSERDAGRPGIPAEPRYISDGGPAFPHSGMQNGPGMFKHITSGGMTLRDWFAGQALAGMMAHPVAPTTAVWRDYARAAYGLADAMLKERGQ